MLKFQMRIISILGLVIVTLSSAVAGEDAKWVCTAEGLASFSYDGSSSAYIHLESYNSGDSYSVTVNETKTVAKGTTGDGTPFTCTKQKTSSKS